jgi:hypothetical protein
VQLAGSPSREREASLAHWRTNILGSSHASAKAIVVDDELLGHVGGWDGESGRVVAHLLGRARQARVRPSHRKGARGLSAAVGLHTTAPQILHVRTPKCERARSSRARVQNKRGNAPRDIAMI